MPELGTQYRRLFILESTEWWADCASRYDPATDLVLTYDFGLRREVERLGGKALYVDHLVNNGVMQDNNFLVYEFFREWHKDATGRDIFQYRDVPFGFSFRLEIWNDLVFYARARLCLEILRTISFQSLFVGTQLGLVESVLGDMGLSFTPAIRTKGKSGPVYYFPIHQWMDEKVRYAGVGGFKYRLRDLATLSQALAMSIVDMLLARFNRKPVVFVQEYHPTRTLVQRLQKDSRVKVVLATFSRSRGCFRYIPIWGRVKKYRRQADGLMHEFAAQRCARLVLANGVDISDGVFRIVTHRISARIAETIRTLDCIIRYFDRHPLQLEVLIANMGAVAPLVDCYCKSRGIPSFMIINGMLVNAYLDEGKYATYINAYSSSIKQHYFHGMSNVVGLGDPRMDAYAQEETARQVSRTHPTVTIGASGHNNIDLNSYLAVEFDFLSEVLLALQGFKRQGVALRIVIKVRANGYIEQYRCFVDEYFPGMVDEILDSAPLRDVLKVTDFFVSIYSQSLFEASCMGIPCVYYKKDTEIMDPPFDGKSELVTVSTVSDLARAFADFRAGHKRFDAFLDKSVMEKYIGPLDGRNLERNLGYFYRLLEQCLHGGPKLALDDARPESE